MLIEDFFARLIPEFARQATSAQDNAQRQAEADAAMAKLTGVSAWLRSYGSIQKLMVE